VCWASLCITENALLILSITADQNCTADQTPLLIKTALLILSNTADPKQHC
jgi:hypothetical protein